MASNQIPGCQSVPAAELFIQLAMAKLNTLNRSPRAVFAISDCQPVVDTINSAYSGNSFLRPLMGALSPPAPKWVSVHVPRERNTDADRLSHPVIAPTVADEAAAAGMRVTFVTQAPDELWATLRTSVQLGSANARRRKKRMRHTNS